MDDWGKRRLNIFTREGERMNQSDAQPSANYITCSCQHCGGHIEFPAEIVGQMIQCPLCGLETLLAKPPATEPQSLVETAHLFKDIDSYLRKNLPPLAIAYYILYLAPGDVRYLWDKTFSEFEVDQWIACFKQMSLAPEIHGPYFREKEGRVSGYGHDREGLDVVTPEEFVQEPTWEERFKILHSFLALYRNYQVPCAVYKYFHILLNLQSLELLECVESWVREAWKDYFIAQSYAKSDQHLIIRHGDEFGAAETAHFAVFKKTPFVIERLEELQRLEEDEKTAENLERLRRSNFKIFVYLMEDLRNGLFKIGQSQTPEKREKTLQSEVPGGVPASLYASA